MNIDFGGKIALVTGASKGIGYDIALALAKGGAIKVYAVSRTLKDLEKLKDQNDKIEPVVCDLTDWDTTAKVIGELGPVDLLVNNAGVSILQPFLDITPEVYSQIFDLNVKSVIQVSQIVARKMIDKGSGGVIVNVSSMASTMSLKDHTCYCASKAALDSLTRSMAAELGSKNIRVNACNPTVTFTDMGRMAWGDPKRSAPVLSRIPIGRFAEVEDVTNVVLYLLSDKSAMLNGVTLPVDGGFTTVGFL